ncbi:MAG: hypothetical protein O2971_18410 [Proteobacteria bacterium]|nr:hypothetical protein [Pseudomonadota bacterium]
MKKFLQWSGGGFGVLVLAMGLFYTYMRTHDGPVEFVPWFTISVGGPFRSGEVVTSPTDWTFLKDREEIEMQTLSQGSSKTIWISVVDGRMFIASGRRNTRIGQLWKQWPQKIVDDDRVILRVDNRLYEQRLKPITEGQDVIAAMTESSRKYGRGGAPRDDSIAREFVWLFEVLPR